MEIREAQDSELRELATLYKREHGKHVMFQGNQSDIQDYLERLDVKYLVYLEHGAIIAAVAVLSQKMSDEHMVHELRHFAVSKAHQSQANAFVGAIETRLGFGKYELHLDEYDTPDIEYFMQQGYEIEGTLTNHHRLDERCYILGKMIK